MGLDFGFQSQILASWEEEKIPEEYVLMRTMFGLAKA
jgi:hypothetical protein